MEGCWEGCGQVRRTVTMMNVGDGCVGVAGEWGGSCYSEKRAVQVV